MAKENNPDPKASKQAVAATVQPAATACTASMCCCFPITLKIFA